MRSRTRMTFVAMVVLAMVAALAPAAFAGKPDKPDKPGGGNSPFAVEVQTVGVHDLAAPYVWAEGAFGYPFYWINAVGDQLQYVVLVDGATIETISWEIGGSNSGEATGLNGLEYRLFHTVVADDIVDGAVTARFTVTSPAADEQTVSEVTDVGLDQDCSEVGLAYSYVNDEHIYEGDLTTGVCRWVPVELGTWNVELTPPEGIKRPIGLGASLRDHAPGNWCATSQLDSSGHTADNSGIVQGRTRGEAITGLFYLPDGTVGGEQAGICLAGGNGGNTMAVGRTDDFILRTGAHIKLMKAGSDA